MVAAVARKKRKLKLPALPKPRFNLRLLAGIAVAVAIGGGIGLSLHQREAVPPPPPKYAAKLSPVPPPAAPKPEAQPEQQAALSPPPETPKEPLPWQRYSVASPPLKGRIPIALVIDDVGVDVVRSKRAIDDLPSMVTLSLLPYGSGIEHQAEEARAKGHEIIVHVSMESEGHAISPGPNALYVNLAPDEIEKRFDWAMSQFTGYVGFNNHMGSRFTAYEPGMRIVLEDAKRRGVMFLDSKTIAENVGVNLSNELGIPFATRQVFLDNDMNVPAVNKQLAELERIAKRDFGAIAIGHPHDATLAALAKWIPTLEAKGFVLVPLTAMAKAPSPATARE
jgi:hypothetical protein